MIKKHNFWVNFNKNPLALRVSQVFRKVTFMFSNLSYKEIKKHFYSCLILSTKIKSKIKINNMKIKEVIKKVSEYIKVSHD